MRTDLGLDGADSSGVLTARYLADTNRDIDYRDPEGLAQEVAGFGPDVVVEAPDSVRDAVIRLLGAARERHTATPADANAPGGMP